MVALGLVEAHSDPTNLLATRWFATPYGIQLGSRLLAVRRAHRGEVGGDAEGVRVGAGGE